MLRLELRLVGEILEAAAAAGRNARTARRPAAGPASTHLGRDRLGVAALHLRDPRAHRVAREARAGRRRRSRRAARRRSRRRRASRCASSSSSSRCTGGGHRVEATGRRAASTARGRRSRPRGARALPTSRGPARSPVLATGTPRGEAKPRPTIRVAELAPRPASRRRSLDSQPEVARPGAQAVEARAPSIAVAHLGAEPLPWWRCPSHEPVSTHAQAREVLARASILRRRAARRREQTPRFSAQLSRRPALGGADGDGGRRSSRRSRASRSRRSTRSQNGICSGGCTPCSASTAELDELVVGRAAAARAARVRTSQPEERREVYWRTLT